MIPITQRFDDSYIYGPLTRQELALITVGYRVIELADGFYVGINKEMPAWADRQILRPINEPEV